MTSIFPLLAFVPATLPLALGPLGTPEVLLILPLLCLGLASTVFWIWMIVDCVKRIGAGDQTKWIWLIVLIFSHFLGAIVYFLAGRTIPANAYVPLNPSAPAPAAASPAAGPAAVAPPAPVPAAAPLSAPPEPSIAGPAPGAPKCPQCGAALAADAPEGLCPRCLVQENLRATAPFTGPGTGGDAPPGPATPTLPPEEIAQKFPHLEILECLGRGGMGVVYKARQSRLDRMVALKILAPGKEKDPQFAERFTREAQALARLNHPNIVTVYDFGETGGLYYLLMEYVDGVNARAMLAAGKIAPLQALAIVPRICEALQYAHEQGVVHRDIKPENVLVDKQGRVKIADFGIAKMLGREAGPTFYTRGQQVMGTPYYMAPEQLERPSEVDHRADIYSLGVVFYEMLTGELPMGRFAPPSHKVQMDVRLDEVVLRTLEKEPQRRYQHASQVKTAVETITGVTSGTPPVPPMGAAQPASASHPPPSPSAAVAPVDPQVLDAMAHRLRLPALGLIAASVLTLVFMLLAVRRTEMPPGLFMLMALASLFGAVRMLQLLLTRREVREAFEANDRQRRAGAIFNQSFHSSPLDAAVIPASAALERAQGLVRVPAIGLMLSAALTLLVAVMVFFIFLIGPAIERAPYPSAGAYGLVAWKSIFLVLLTVPLAVVGLIILTGARRMLRLEGHGWAVAAAVLALLTPPFILGWLFGLWALVVLSRRDVGEAFAGRAARAAATAPPRSSAGKWAFGIIAAVMLVPLLLVFLWMAAYRMERRVVIQNDQQSLEGALNPSEMHALIFEAPAALVDRVVPSAMRAGATAYQTAAIGQDALAILLRDAAPSALLLDRRRNVRFWPGEADTWTYARTLAGVEYVGSGAGTLGVQHQDSGLMVRAEYQVMHAPSQGSPVVASILYQGVIPPEMALVFLLPLQGENGQGKYLVIAFDPSPADQRSPRQGISTLRTSFTSPPLPAGPEPELPAPEPSVDSPAPVVAQPEVEPSVAEESIAGVVIPAVPGEAPPTPAAPSTPALPPPAITHKSTMGEDFQTRLAAAGTIASFVGRDAALGRLAVDAAVAGEVDIVKQALHQMQQFTVRDNAAREAALKLVQAGQRSAALEVAGTITQFTVRDATLRDISQ